MSARPVDVDRFPQLTAIERERREALSRCAGPDPRTEQAEGIGDTRVTLTYEDDAGQEITVDLDEVPDEELPESVRRWQPAQQYAVVEDIRFMADQGETLAGVAERLSVLREARMTAKSVERFLHRYGAHALVWQLKAAEDGDPAPDSPDWHLARSIGDGRSARSKLSPEQAEAARRQWVRGPQDSGVAAAYPTGPTPWSPFSRAARGQGVKGRKL